MLALYYASILALTATLAVTTEFESGRWRAFRVGGLTFVRLGRVQVSFCVVRKGGGK